MSQTIYRGQVWQYEAPISASANGSIQYGSRPVIIVSNDLGNKYSPVVNVVPCTRQINKKLNQPTHARITICGNPSLAAGEQCTPVNVSDLKYKKCTLSVEDMAKVDHILSVAFGLIPVHKSEQPPPPPVSGAIDKFYKKYPKLAPNPTTCDTKHRNHWDSDTITRFIFDCGELSSGAVQEKYKLSQKSIDNYLSRFTIRRQRLCLSSQRKQNI